MTSDGHLIVLQAPGPVLDLQACLEQDENVESK